jgi:hypothetical protein
MLKFSIEPQPDGTFAVGYKVPGCTMFRPSTICTTKGQANEAIRCLNDERQAFEGKIKADQVARGLRIFKLAGV